MPGLLLAPYNDSMRLGQGFNSFLQVPCIDNAVSFDESKVVVDRAHAGHSGISQVVSYSSRFVEKISDVVKSMNISAGSSIKSGSVEIGGNSLSVDEAKFAASDLNAVVSVKVINQTTRLVDVARFQPIESIRTNNDKFFEIYGDCYISGFIEGGDLHGIVSIKILEASSKAEIERIIKGHMNGSGGASEFSLSEGSGKSSSSSAMNQTETTITVNWSGGGQIKPDDEDWSLESLFKAAAGFPAKVAACPQRTWAILTKYDNNRDFVEWADHNIITIPQYQGVQSYTSDLLDMFMEYKNNITRLQAVLSNPLGYVMSPVSNAIHISVASLVNERKAMKREMNLIVKAVDQICLEPHKIEEIESKFVIQSPEIWATRLPIPRSVAEESGDLTAEQALEELSMFSFVAAKAPSTHGPVFSTAASTTPPSLDSALKSSIASIQTSTREAAQTMMPPSVTAPEAQALCTPEVEAKLSDWEKNTISTMESRRKYRNYRFGFPCSSNNGKPFNDAIDLNGVMVPVAWPKRIEIHPVDWGNDPIIGWTKINYEQIALTHGNDRGTALASLTVNLGEGEYVNKVRMCKGSHVWGIEGIVFIELTTSAGKVVKIGTRDGREVVEDVAPSGFPGLKGFFGCEGDVVDRIGAIWAKQ